MVATPPADTPTRSLARLARWLPATLLVLAVTLPCWPTLVGGQTFYYRDIYLYYLPQRALAGSLIRQGMLPIWDPYFHAGSALWANPDNLVAHPTTLLFALLPQAQAFGIDTALFLALAAGGAFLLARRLGLSRSASVVAGAAFAACGITTSLVSFHAQFLGLTPLPALLCAWDAWIRGGTRRTLALVSVLAALVALSAGAEAALSGAALVAAWTLLAPGKRPIGRRVAVLAACGVLALAISAPAWMPTLEVVRTTLRADGYPWHVASMWSVHPARLPELLVPGFLGNVHALNEAEYWGRGLENGLTPYFTSIAFGPLVILLAVAGAFMGIIPRRLRMALVGLALLGIVLSTLGWWPGMASLVGDAHFRVRFPVKALELGVLPIALLAGAGADAVGRAARGRVAVAVGLGGVAVLLGALGTACWLLPDAAGSVAHAWMRIATPMHLASLGHAFGAAAFQALVGALLVSLAGHASLARVARAALAAAVVLFLVDLDVRVNPTVAREEIETEPELAKAVKRVIGDGRLYRAVVDEPGRLAASSDDALHLTRYNLESLRFYTATRWGIPVALHVDPDGLGPAASARAADALQLVDWPHRLPLLESAGVTAIVTNEELEVDGLEPVGGIDVGASRPLRLYRVERATPLARVVFQARSRTGDDLAATFDPGHDPLAEAIIAGDSQRPPRGDEPCRATVLSDRLEPDREIAVDSTCSGWLVLAIPWQSGIEASVDGVTRRVEARGPMVRAEGAFMATAIEAGHHVVTWRYRLRTLIPSLVLAALGLGIVGAIALPSLSRGRPSA